MIKHGGSIIKVHKVRIRVRGSENTSQVADSPVKVRISNDPEIQSVDFDEDNNTVPSENHETTPEVAP